MLEQVVINVAGRALTNFVHIAVHASVKDAARSFAVGFVDTLGMPEAGAIFAGGPDVTITASGETIFTGFVDKVEPAMDAEIYKLEVCGRSKGADAVDCSCDHTKPDYVKSDVHKVARDQDRFGINFACDFSPDGFDRWRPNPGDTLFHALRPLCEDEGATMAGQADGSVKITRAGESAQPQNGYLAEGVSGQGTIWKGSASFDLSAQHSRLEAHGQSYKGSGPENLEIVGTAANSNVKRTRPHVEHHDRHTDRDRLKRRARRRRDKEQGEGVRAHVVARGWRDTGGTLWTPGKTIMVVSPSLYLAQTLLIEQVVYHQSGADKAGGTFAELHMVDPRAHGGKGGGVDQSGADWGFDDSAAQ